jgi:hypothetical protein
VSCYQKFGKESVDWANTLQKLGKLYAKQSKGKHAIYYEGEAAKMHANIKEKQS